MSQGLLRQCDDRAKRPAWVSAAQRPPAWLQLWPYLSHFAYAMPLAPGVWAVDGAPAFVLSAAQDTVLDMLLQTAHGMAFIHGKSIM